MKILTIVRGLPGSGKSTIAKTLNCFHREADMFHMIDGQYCFDPTKIKDAHAWCKSEIEKAMRVGIHCAVSNTFTQRWEYQPYIDLANRYGYQVQVIECHGDLGNIHSVPEEVLQRMEERWEPYETGN